jgi:hypothetical protein
VGYWYEYMEIREEYDEYTKQKVMEANVAKSMLLDGQRSRMGPSATDLANRARRARALLNGHS